jgi:hypothetical protein
LPITNAAAVGQLRKAGAVVWGKTIVPLAASDQQSYAQAGDDDHFYIEPWEAPI